MKVIHMKKLSDIKHTFDVKYKKVLAKYTFNVNPVKVH